MTNTYTCRLTLTKDYEITANNEAEAIVKAQNMAMYDQVSMEPNMLTANIEIVNREDKPIGYTIPHIYHITIDDEENYYCDTVEEVLEILEDYRLTGVEKEGIIAMEFGDMLYFNICGIDIEVDYEPNIN